MNREKMELNGEWQLLPGEANGYLPEELTGGCWKAEVPGCVHTDLMRAGILEDPFVGMNEDKSHWVGLCEWTYQCDFDYEGQELDDNDRLDLVFEGLDTIAIIEFNGQLLGQTVNMHRRYRFDVRHLLQAEDNRLRITFRAPLSYVRQMEEHFPGLPHQGEGSNPKEAHHLIRKMACNFGWDWGPALTTCGIWRPLYLERWRGAHLQDIRPELTIKERDYATLTVCCDANLDSSLESPEICVCLRTPEGEIVAEASASLGFETRVSLTIAHPRLWWPIGYGDQPLYTLEYTIRDARGDILDAGMRRIGLRTVELLHELDSEPVGELGRGREFCLVVNGQRIYAKGANWIPDDCFPARMTPERYRRRISQAVEANMNLLRVWGGGTYEDHAFYSICDELGILVWQDFCFACACYPEEEPFGSEVEAEARDNIARLAYHPSLALWNGSNECIWGTFEWSKEWIETRTEGKRSWGLGYYLDVLPSLVRALDAGRPYWASSPYSGSMDIHPNDDGHGNQHLWRIWNGQGSYHNYLNHAPRFASEFGFQGPPSWPTLERAIPEGDRTWFSPTVVHHNKQIRGQDRGIDQIRNSFDVPNSFDDTWYLASLNQARAITLACEWMRALTPWNSGSIIWQLNDCWPVTSWSMIDSAGHPKLLWYAARCFYRPRLLTLLPKVPFSQDDRRPCLCLHNDSSKPWSGVIRIGKYNMNEDCLQSQEWEVSLKPRESMHFPMDDSWCGQAGEFLVSDFSGERAWWFFGEDRNIPYPEPDFEAELTIDGCAHTLSLTARSLLREVCLFPEILNPGAMVDKQRVNLLRGETASFHFNSEIPLTLERLTLPDVLRMANRYGASVSVELES